MVLTTTSFHTESLRKKYHHDSKPDDAGPFGFFRAALNVGALIECVKNAVPTNATANGNKRAASPLPFNGPAKRVKLSDTTSLAQNVVPFFSHTFTIQYTSGPAEDEEGDLVMDVDDPINANWVQEEQVLLALLDELYGSSCAASRPPLDLGPITTGMHKHRLCACLSPASTTGDFLLLIPSLFSELDANDYDFTSPGVEDLAVAAYVLMLDRRAEIHLSLHLIPLAPNSHDFSLELPFRLQVELSVSLRVPQVFDLDYQLRPKVKMLEIEDAQRRLLTHVFPPSACAPPAYDGETNIPFLYSVLRPAPKLPSVLADKYMQPAELRPTLLPFQRRSVGWLLEHEGKVVDDSGAIVCAADIAVPSKPQPLMFWEDIKLDSGETWYIHRLTGVLSPNIPVAGDIAPGAILAEEPGLGKTLECISLILLNPAGPQRNPSVCRWDYEAKVQVKEIKTTLIVTPPSLATQWADELALHAPTLKVLVYEGWSKVDVPIIVTNIKGKKVQHKRLAAGDERTSARSSRSNTPGMANGRAKSAPRIGKRGASVSTDAMDTANDREDPLDWCSYINTFDVCITTYTVLRQDFNVARAAPTRPRRDDVVYSNLQKPRSPLVMVEWWRVIMDEVQMVGGGNSAKMVSLIPRISSFAVSGTPARAHVSDLIHILKFLRVDNIIGPTRLWNRLQKPGFAPYFAQIFERFGIRTNKSAVKNELTIPQQTRYLVGVELGPVERHVYDQNIEIALRQLGLDARGVAASENWELDSGLLRALIRKLRGICTHPQVGQLQRAGDNLFKTGALKSMAQVLDAMKEQNWRNLVDDRRARIQAIIRCAQLQQQAATDPARYQHALNTLLDAEKAAGELFKEVKAAIAEHEARCDELKNEAAALRQVRELVITQPRSPDDEAEVSDVPDDKRKEKGKEPERAAGASAASDIAELQDGDLPRTAAGEEHRNKRGALHNRLRDCYVVLHRIKFLQGDVHHMLGPSHAAEEDVAYQEAESIRRSLLKSTELNAMRAMKQLTHSVASQDLSEDALLIDSPFMVGAGLKSQILFDEANEIVDLMNEQSKLLWQWRSKILALLTQKLSCGDDEASGDEYARTLETQGEAETYLQAYTALMADHREVLVAERTLLAAHDYREKKKRRTKAAMKAEMGNWEARLLEEEEDVIEDVELAPEHEVLKKELDTERKGLLGQFEGRAVKSVMADLTGVLAKLPKVDSPERAIAHSGVIRLRQLIASQQSLMGKLDADLTLFRKAFNERILYFRQLQEISDSVTEVEWEGNILAAIEACKAQQADMDTMINTARARMRYLEHLATDQSAIMDEDENSCVLCKCDFKRGYMTQCAHVFCEECMKAWISKKEGKCCPVCRKEINTHSLQRFTVNPDQEHVPPILVQGEPVPKSRREFHYNFIDPNLLNDIESVEIFGSYGSKIQTLVRHLLYLQMAEPGAKSIVFSAWADSLHIIEHALQTNAMPCLRIDQTTRKQSAVNRFKNDPTILVLLLHGERENAGLNVTCASRVFLVESVVHHGFEVQAIARIDRMGQLKPTEVYCYYAEDTLERNILDLAARQGLSLYTLDHATEALDVTAFASDSHKKSDPTIKKQVRRGDFVFNTEDMLAILFPHMFEDLEYLIPGEYDPPSANMSYGSRSAINSNAIAGPSRCG